MRSRSGPRRWRQGRASSLQVLRVDTVGDVAQHDGGTDVDAGLNLHQIDGLRLIPSPEIHVRLMDRGVSGQGPSVGLDAVRRMPTVSIFGRLTTSRECQRMRSYTF
jgi:hypothetical protein